MKLRIIKAHDEVESDLLSTIVSSLIIDKEFNSVSIILDTPPKPNYMDSQTKAGFPQNSEFESSKTTKA